MDRPSFRQRSFSSYPVILSSSDGSNVKTERAPGVIDALALELPVSHQLASLLDGSLAQALARLNAVLSEREVLLEDAEDSEGGIDTETDNGNDTDGTTATMTASTQEDEADVILRAPPRPQPSFVNGEFREGNDAEALEAFLQQASQTLSAMREELRRKASSNAVVEALEGHYQAANEIFHKIRMCSASVLPDFPAVPSLASARASLAKRRFSISQYSWFSDESASGDQPSSPPSTAPLPEASLPSPPLTAVRAFFEKESARLASKLPSRPPFEGWAEGISHVLSDASHFVQDEGEKLVGSVVDEAEKLRLALKFGAQRLLHYHELPEDFKNNKYILSSYRFIPISNWPHLLLSLFQWHNETINVYSHLLPAIYIPYYIYYIFPTTPLGESTHHGLVDRSINLSFLIASELCLLLSAAWHLAAGCGTFSVFHSCATLDYLGISALISTSVLTLQHQGLRCRPTSDLVYGTATCVLGCLGLYLPWKSWFNKRENKNYRISFFLALSAAGIAPMLHISALYGVGPTWRFFSPVIFSLLAYIIGLLFYTFDFPEVLRPGGIFDTLFHSHQFWHTAIVAAIALHWWALTHMSQKGLEGFSCAGKDLSLDQHSSYFSQLYNEL